MAGRAFVKPLIVILIAAVAVGIWQWRRMNSTEQDYYAYYYNIQGLQRSSPVQIKGVRVGKISSIDLNGKGRVKVTLTLRKDYKLPEGTTAFLASGGLTGDKIIQLRPGNSTSILPQESVLPTAYDTSVMEMSARISPMLEMAKSVLKTSDSALTEFRGLLSSGVLTTATRGLITVEENTRGFANAAVSLNRKTDNLCRSVDSTENNVKNVVAGNAKRTQSITDLKNKTQELTKNSISENVKSAHRSISSLSAAITKAGKSSMINDKKAYQDFTNNMDTLNQSLQQTYKDPPGITLFPKKKK